MLSDDVCVLDDSQQAATLLDQTRMRIVKELATSPDSAAGLARRLEMPRQRLNYHLRELEKQQLVKLVEERRKGNCIERVLQAAAPSYLISPQALGEIGPSNTPPSDRLSWTYLVWLAARAIRDVATLVSGARRAKKRLSTFSMENVVRLATPADQQAFIDELTQAWLRVAAKYHDESSPRGRPFRLMLLGYPEVKTKGGSS